ncbi:PREDICTED: opsin-3-like [Branchiostoma belcheri]|uniref:Opsin-3-like n=1 Tax=Branchiostoma belcheri TaxID=7741 RepID=A0A6P4ZVL2_BRABE|nr:PREDICTED: opsin-3-like [Branchiostoma belcheri]
MRGASCANGSRSGAGSTDCASTFQQPGLAWRAVASVLAIIAVLGIVNNSTTLYLVGRYSQLRTPFNMLVVNLTVSDLLVCVLGTPFSFVSSLKGRWMFGRAGCVWYGFINSLLGIVSLTTLTVISYERHQMMKRPPNAPKLSYRWVALSVLFVWVYSLLWTVPPLMGWSSYGPESHGVSCSVNWVSRTANDTSYIVAFFVGRLAVPVAVIVVSYTRFAYFSTLMSTLTENAAVTILSRDPAGLFE